MTSEGQKSSDLTLEITQSQSSEESGNPGKSPFTRGTSLRAAEPDLNGSKAAHRTQSAPATLQPPRPAEAVHQDEEPPVFRCMVVGAQGIGKSTFLSSLWELNEVTLDNGESTRDIQQLPPFSSEANSFLVSVIDTPGYGDKMDSQDRLWTIENWIEDFLEQEDIAFRKGNRPALSVIDCCFVFFAPHRHSEVDFELMKILSQYTTIIPILAKADTYTLEELVHFQRRLHDALADNGIDVTPWKSFNFLGEAGWQAKARPPSEAGALVEEKTLWMPFSIIGGSSPRLYPWGAADPANPQHSGLRPLRYLLLENYSLLHKAAEEKTRKKINTYGFSSRPRKWNRRLDRYLRTHQQKLAGAAKVHVSDFEVSGVSGTGCIGADLYSLGLSSGGP